MSIKRFAYFFLAAAALAAGVLACNLPEDISSTLPSTVTPYVPPGSTPERPTAVLPTDTLPPHALPTDTPPGATEAPPSTETPTPTEKPKATNTLPPTAVPTQPPTGEPLVIVDQGYEIVDWNALPDSKEWEGHLRIRFTGGVPPYTFSIGNRDPQSENLHYFRYGACRGAALRVDVWSADGQHAYRDVWVEAPWCPTETPNP